MSCVPQRGLQNQITHWRCPIIGQVHTSPPYIIRFPHAGAFGEHPRGERLADTFWDALGAPDASQTASDASKTEHDAFQKPQDALMTPPRRLKTRQAAFTTPQDASKIDFRWFFVSKMEPY